MPTERSELAGATVILRKCLGLETGQSLVIILDETTAEVAAVLTEAADREAIPYAAFFVPIAVQQRIPYKTDLSFILQEATQSARAILNCVNARPECMPFRQRILETQWSARTRIGHMPGASLDVLRLANVDLAQIVSDCHIIEEAMARGNRLELLSRTTAGLTHSLVADIGGWSRLPVASDGVIGDGVWGNVPSGETYIAPIEGTAEGSVVINGSVPGLVVPSDVEIMLHFKEGCLVLVAPTDNDVARWLETSQFEPARAAGDSNWCQLAEIGIGVDPALSQLTGNMMLDEKSAGTAHIAIGDNQFMGGTIIASIHCDMVITKPTVIIDGSAILTDGKLVQDFRRDKHLDVDLTTSPLLKAVSVARSGIETTRTHNGKLLRVLRNESGRHSYCQVGDDETGRLAFAVYRCLPQDEDWLPIEELASQVQMPSQTVRRLLHVMWAYELVDYR